MSFYYNVARSIIRIFHWIFSQECRVSGEIGYPPGAKIIAGNHPNATDGLFLPFVFIEKLHYFVQGDIFDIPFIGWLLARCDQIPVNPGYEHLALLQAARMLRAGKVVALFPEARLNPDGQPVKSSPGAVRLALMTGAPIIPVGFYVPSGNLRYMVRMKKERVSQGHWQTHGQCYLHIGASWLPVKEIGKHIDKLALNELTEKLMELIKAQVGMAMQAYTRETGLPATLASFTDTR